MSIYSPEVIALARETGVTEMQAYRHLCDRKILAKGYTTRPQGLIQERIKRYGTR